MSIGRSTEVSKCVDNYVKEIEVIRKKYNKQLDVFITKLNTLKSKNADPIAINETYSSMKKSISNEAFETRLLDSKIKTCICKNYDEKTNRNVTLGGGGAGKSKKKKSTLLPKKANTKKQIA